MPSQVCALPGDVGPRDPCHRRGAAHQAVIERRDSLGERLVVVIGLSLGIGDLLCGDEQHHAVTQAQGIAALLDPVQLLAGRLGIGLPCLVESDPSAPRKNTRQAHGRDIDPLGDGDDLRPCDAEAVPSGVRHHLSDSGRAVR